jgi:hypothetical protein
LLPGTTGRGGGTRTPDLSVPNAARYQLRYTPQARIASPSIRSRRREGEKSPGAPNSGFRSHHSVHGRGATLEGDLQLGANHLLDRGDTRRVGPVCSVG